MRSAAAYVSILLLGWTCLPGQTCLAQTIPKVTGQPLRYHMALFEGQANCLRKALIGASFSVDVAGKKSLR